jgi:predicted RecA/RadA family phage recombinase
MAFEAQLLNGDPLKVDHTPAAAVSAGAVVVVGELPLVATQDIAANALGALNHGNAVYRCAKEAPLVIAIGALVYWDDANNRVTTTAGALKKFGYAAKAGASADTYLEVIHKPGG